MQSKLFLNSGVLDHKTTALTTTKHAFSETFDGI